MRKSNFVTTVIVIFSFLLFPFYSFAAGAVKPLESAERPTWNVGDVRTYQMTYQGEKGFIQTETVAAISKEGYIVTIEREGKKTTERYSLDLILEKTMDSSGNIIEKYDSGITKIKWPLKASDSWTTTHVVFNKSSAKSLTMTIDITVTAKTLTMDSKEIPTLEVVAKRKVGQQTNYIDKLERWYDPITNCFIKSALTRLIGDVGQKDNVKELVFFTQGQGKSEGSK